MKKFLIFPRSARSRRFFYFLSALLVAVGLLPWTVPCHAQDTQTTQTVPESKERFDFAAGGFYQITNASNGNFIRDDTTESGGALFSFRQPWKPWMGYEANLGYTKFFEAYNKGVVKVESDVTDISFAYLLHTPTYYGMQGFFSIGGGIIIFAPIPGTITNLNNPTDTHLPSQLLPELTYTLGLNYPLFHRFGVRGQFRSLKYKTPDFHELSLDTKTLRSTYEPTLSVYYRF